MAGIPVVDDTPLARRLAKNIQLIHYPTKLNN